ncbi:hypothetical protein GCM10017668_66010 [Streptomyces tuirus]|uniref:Uncharacterized protein n=1 Tax=Streptomyces tuirus TaxID=68278 RepID=A0A7G1NNI1_9ACTN|nr:hypothetical protein GCM10017668_66010 [Streptomyces tuirus]
MPGSAPSPAPASVFSSTTCAFDRITAVSITSPTNVAADICIGTPGLRVPGLTRTMPSDCALGEIGRNVPFRLLWQVIPPRAERRALPPAAGIPRLEK